jgi:2-polyprenyl-6-methoxyphenol hydroxylase-like FAD-dependent oxidoreductase
MSFDETVLIAGAGIGGLALGAALQRARIRYEIFERVTTLREVGAGILVQAGAMRALRHIGLESEVVSLGCQLERGTGRNVAGALLSTTPFAGLGAPTVAIHRARLHSALLGALDKDRVHLGRKIQSFVQDEHGVRALFEDGSRSPVGGLLIGADGLRSAVRGQLLGDAPPRYAGYTSWRGIAPSAGLVPSKEILEIWGRGLRFGAVSLGPAETYWFAVANAPAGEPDADRRATVLARFAHFSGPALALVRATPAESVLRTDIEDRAPIASWSRERVALLGDAAHPTTPNLGQGGSMAIEDAVVLSHCLSTHASVRDALAAYERARVARTTAIVNASWRFGRVAQMEGRLSCWLRDLTLRSTPQSVIRRRLLESASFSLV